MDGASTAQDGVCEDLAFQDRALLEGLRMGCEEAYETLILRYEQPVFNIVCRVLDDPEDAADITQEVFLKVFRKIDAFRGDSSLKTWIYRIAVNEAHNQRRWFGRHRRQEVTLEPASGEIGVGETVADRGPNPYETARDRETHALIETALKQVSSHYRVALVLREMEGLSYEEIAGILEVSLGTVKSRILRGREALRKLLAEQFQPSPAVRSSAAPSSMATARSVVRASSPAAHRPGRLCANGLEGSDVA
jgi:RNA polymerase sigma-70 factor (ECF subfamily)